MTGFIYYLAALGAILSGSTLLPSLIAFGTGETLIGFQMLLYGSLGGFLCVSVLLAISGRPVGIERRSAALLVVVSWIIFPVLVAIPLSDLTDLTFLESLFQSASSFTTTGSLVFGNPEIVPKSIMFFLAQLQWMGGLATLITFILVLSPWEIGGLPKIGSVSDAASIIASEYRLVKFCGRLFRAMLALTLLCFVLLLLAAVPVYEAAILSFTALSTGGIVPVADGLDLMLGDAGMIIMSFFLLLGATSIFWQRHLVNLRISELIQHRESYFVIAVWFVLSIILAYRLMETSGAGDSGIQLHSITEGMMNAASVVSTSGIQTRPGVFALLVPTLVLLLVLMGGGCFSTAGGLKYFRIGGVFSHSQHELNRLIYPSSVPPKSFGGTDLSVEFMKGIWGFFSIWLVTLGFLTFLMTLSGLNFQSGFTAIVAALSNAGPLYGSFWDVANAERWPAYADMNGLQLGVLTFAMIVGRLEIIVLFASLALVFRVFR